MNPDEPLRTKNLAKEDPAPMDDTLSGYVWLPRMVDKARAAGAGTLGSYFKYPCPIDRHALARLGVSPESFAELAIASSTGLDILKGLSSLHATPPETAAFDPLRIHAELHQDGS